MLNRMPGFWIFVGAMVAFASGCASLIPDTDFQKVAPPSSPRQIVSQVPPITRPTSIYIGMSMREVEEFWGEPSQVYRAGLDQTSPNQKWVYHLSPSGMGVHASRVVYFENGQVIGWETSH